MKLSRKVRLIAASTGMAVGILVLAVLPWPELGVIAHAARHGNKACSLASLKGVYAIERQGSFLTSSGPVPYGEVGIGNYDGNGYIWGTVTVNVNGSVTSDLPFTGTYTVNSDCTGTNQIFPSGSPTLHNTFVVFGAGQGYVSTQTDSFAVVQTRIERLP